MKFCKIITALFVMLSFCVSLGTTGEAADAAQIKTLHEKDKKYELNYFKISGIDSSAAKRINERVKAEADNFVQSVKAENKGNGNQTTAVMNYEIMLNDGWLSAVLYEYTYTKGAAHGMTYAKTFSFNLATGKELAYKDVADKSVPEINKLLDDSYKRGEIGLFPDFSGINEIPSDFYVDASGSAHLVFQLYEIAPYAAGIIDLDLKTGTGKILEQHR
jgi:hypothetical protein